MSNHGDLKSYTSIGPLLKTSSETHSISSSQRQASKKARGSKSSVSVQRSSLSPQKESFYSEGSRLDKIQEQDSETPEPSPCECGPDLYTRVLGPTADETILTGLQTVIDLCSRLKVCGEQEESEEEPSREQDIPERDVSTQPGSKVVTAKSQTERNVAASKNQTDRNTTSAAFQVNPSVRTVESQTMPFPEMVSKILETAGLAPEVVSRMIQTSFLPKQSLASIFMQTSNPDLQSGSFQTSRFNLHSKSMQTSRPDLQSNSFQTSRPNLQSNSFQTSRPNLQSNCFQTLRSSLTSATNQTSPPDLKGHAVQTCSGITYEIPDCICSENASKGDEHKCICPPEPPASKCKCCKCSSSSLAKSSRSSTEKAPCITICGGKKVQCVCDPSKRKRSSKSLEDDQPSPLEVKYAVTKISKYKDFTTFEVMKSTKHQPRQIPKGIEGVFVLRKKNGGSGGDTPSASRENVNNNRSKNGVRNGSLKNINGAKSRSREDESDRTLVEGN